MNGKVNGRGWMKAGTKQREGGSKRKNKNRESMTWYTTQEEWDGRGRTRFKDLGRRAGHMMVDWAGYECGQECGNGKNHR